MTRIVGGTWRGRALAVPTGTVTRPSALRLRQAMFDMLAHAPWARGVLSGRYVLDLFAGTGALGLEALSRGAAFVEFVERDATAVAVLQRNVASLQAGSRTRIIHGDALRTVAGPVADLVLLDPPYDEQLVPRACAALVISGRTGGETLHVAEIGRGDASPDTPLLADRRHGAGRIVAWRGSLPRPTAA